MQKFINNPDTVTIEMLEGLALAHADIVSLELGGKLVVNKKLAEADRMTIVTIGGSGHEPAFCGFVGEGMVDVLQIGLICLSILSIISNVLAFFIAFGCHAVYKAFVCSVKSSVFN